MISQALLCRRRRHAGPDTDVLLRSLHRVMSVSSILVLLYCKVLARKRHHRQLSSDTEVAGAPRPCCLFMIVKFSLY